MEQVTNFSDEQQYVVRNVKEIIQILNELIKQKSFIKVSFNEGLEQCLTTIIEVDAQNNALYLDIGLDEAFNSRLLASHNVLFTKETGVRVKWTSHHLSEVTLKDGRAIKVALPESLIRLQRREFFRVATPVVNPVTCEIPTVDESHPELNGTLSFTLADVSLGGVGIVAEDPLNSALKIGTYFDSCQIVLPEFGTTNLTLQVKNIIPMPIKDGTIKYRIGLLYVKPSLANEALLHRYTFNLERELCSRLWNPMD